MTQGLEVDAAEEWIGATLIGDAALVALGITDVYVGPVPQRVAYPYVHASFMAGTDLMVIGPVRVWANVVYLIEAVTQDQSYGTVQAIYARVDALLHRGMGGASLGTVIACVREQPFRSAEALNGVSYRRLGGVYRIYAQG